MPTCIMEAKVGADLKESMGGTDRVIIDVTDLGSLNITTAPAATSDNCTALQLSGGLCRNSTAAVSTNCSPTNM